MNQIPNIKCMRKNEDSLEEPNTASRFTLHSFLLKQMDLLLEKATLYENTEATVTLQICFNFTTFINYFNFYVSVCLPVHV